jgi:hypothetical protein
MSDKEMRRGQLMGRLVEGSLSQIEVAHRLGISVRQVKRIKRRYVAEGMGGVISKKRGQPSNRRIREEVLVQVRELIGKQYADFGPTLAAEKLREQHGIELSVERVRQEMIAAGYWKPRRGATIRAYPMRARRPRRGELVQIDGSPHDWFEGRQPSCCLLVFIDDATSELMDLQFVDNESTLDYMAVLERYILRHGMPMALYSDRHSIFRVNGEEIDSEAQTQFSRALDELGIEAIHAHSPQAKGRVERANQTLQDRLVKEMRLQGINTKEQANAWLPTYIAEHNRRFAVKPALPEDAHVPYAGAPAALRQILSIQITRTLSKNLSCQYLGQLLQVKTTGLGLGLRHADVIVHRHHDGSMTLSWKGRALTFSVMTKPVKQQPSVSGKEVNARVDRALKKRSSWVPKNDHPWKKAPPECFEQKPPTVALFAHPKEVLPMPAT